MMTKSEAFIRSILGAVRTDVQPFAAAVDIAAELLFTQELALDDIYVTKDIYPAVAVRTGKTISAVSRQIERTANLCWDNMDEEQKILYIGRLIPDIHAPRDMIIYFAVFLHCGQPFFQAASSCPRLIF